MTENHKAMLEGQLSLLQKASESKTTTATQLAALSTAMVSTMTLMEKVESGESLSKGIGDLIQLFMPSKNDLNADSIAEEFRELFTQDGGQIG